MLKYKVGDKVYYEGLICEIVFINKSTSSSIPYLVYNPKIHGHSGGGLAEGARQDNDNNRWASEEELEPVAEQIQSSIGEVHGTTRKLNGSIYVNFEGVEYDDLKKVLDVLLDLNIGVSVELKKTI